MRADRLVAVLLLLQSRRKVTAAEVAEELEVSERTARRDLDALAMAGVPLYATRGRGGGWELVGGATTNLTGLTATEARALLVAAATGTGSGGGAGSTDPTDPIVQARRKLAQALPAPFRTAAAAVDESIHVDRNPWRRTVIPDDARHLDLLQQAVLEERQILLDYRRPQAESTRRIVDPYGLVTKASVWYLIGGTDRGRRTFRVSRIEDVTLLDSPAVRPAGFDIAQAWSEIKADFGAMVSADVVRAEVEVAAWTVGPLRSLPAVEVEVRGEWPSSARSGATVVSATVTAAAVPQLAHALAGFGSAVEVLGPASVRHELARLGRELVAAYDRPAGG
ncbi:MAG: YafY family protein [Actinomycetota bacterium]